MSIESRIPNQEINIADLSLETPEMEKLPFDADLEITPEDREKMKRTLQNYRSERLWHDYSMWAMYMQVLDSQMPPKTFWSPMSDELATMRRNKQWGNFIFQATAMRVVYPEVQTLTLGDQENIKLYIDSLRKENKWHLFSSTAAFTKILDPDMAPNLSRKDWEWIEDALNTARQSKDWRVFSSIASTTKILDPDHDLDLSSQDWAGLKKELEEDREASVKWKHFAPHAMIMKILAAPKVTVEAPGVLKFYKQSELHPTSSVASLPETKKF